MPPAAVLFDMDGTLVDSEKLWDVATYNKLIDACADGLMSSWPTLLERILNERGIARPGSPASTLAPPVNHPSSQEARHSSVTAGEVAAGPTVGAGRTRR